MHDVRQTTLVVEARDLDTDERTVATFAVERPGVEDAERAQVAGLVARLHPHARMRSFGHGAASFLDSQSLVVAHYRDTGQPPSADGARSAASQGEQRPLFAA